MTEILDDDKIGAAMRRISALGEYLILDDIADLGKIDHFHHYIVGLIMFILGMGGELAAKVTGLIDNFTTLLPSTSAQTQSLTKLEELPYFMPGTLSEEDQNQSPYERAMKKVAFF